MNKAPVNRKHVVGRLLSYVGRGYLALFVVVILCILVSAVASVSGSLFLGTLIDNYIVPLAAMANPDFSGLLRVILMMACLYLVGALCAFAYNRIMVRAWINPSNTGFSMAISGVI